MELRSNAALVGNALRPMHNQGIAHATAMGVLLVAFAWRVSSLRPAPGIIIVRMLGTDLIQPRHTLVDRLDIAVEVTGIVDHALWPALLARSSKV